MSRTSLRRFICAVTALAFATSLVATSAFADELSYQRDNFKMILKATASEVEKNYYDPQLKGLEWKALVEQAKTKIDNAKNVSEMMTAVFVVVNKLHDSHTVFLPPGRNVRYRFGYEAKPIGDGIYIYEVKKKFPAAAAGIQVGDRIVSVNGYTAEPKTYDDMMFAFRVLRNLPVLELMVQTDNGEPRKIRLEGERRVQAQMLDFTHDVSDIWDLIRDDENATAEEVWHTSSFKDGIGYAQLRQFPSEGEDFFHGVIEKANAKRALILDLRGNGGGSLDTLRNFAGNFTDSPVLMQKVYKRKKTEDITVTPKRPHYNMPVFLLIDSETGSAAEVLARHLQLTGKAVVIGEKSPGRVTLSNYFSEQIGTDRVIPFGVQINVGRVVMADGNELEGKGVIPDQQCTPTGKEMREDHDVCLWKAVELARAALKLPEDNSHRSVAKIETRQSGSGE